MKRLLSSLPYRLTAEGKDHPVPKKWRTQLIAAAEKRVGIREAAAPLGISKSTVGRLADEGKLAFSHARKGHRRFSIDVLESYALENKAK